MNARALWALLVLVVWLGSCAGPRGGDHGHDHAHGHDHGVASGSQASGDKQGSPALGDDPFAEGPPAAIRARFQASQKDFAPLEFLAGIWVREEGELWHREVWGSPRGGRMVGHGQLVRGDQTAFTEALEVRALGGLLVYRAAPEDQEPTYFPLVEAADGYARFENPDHDFPRTIEYRRVGDELFVRLAGEEPARGNRPAEAREARLSFRRSNEL